MVLGIDRLGERLENGLQAVENGAMYLGREVLNTPSNIVRGTSYALRSTTYMFTSKPENMEKAFKLSANLLDLAGYTNTAAYTKVVIDTICARNIADGYLKLKYGYHRMSNAELTKAVALFGAGLCETTKWLQTYAKVDTAEIALAIGQTRLIRAVGGDKVISYALQFSLTVTKNSLVMFASTISIGQATYKIYNDGFTIKELLEITTNSLKIGVIVMSGGAAAIFVVYAVDLTSTAFKASVLALNTLSYVKVLYNAPVGAF